MPHFEITIFFNNNNDRNHRDLIVGSLKWLFIEQDIRYRNYSGRDILKIRRNALGFLVHK